jgi:haloalkane dehalogenase
LATSSSLQRSSSCSSATAIFAKIGLPYVFYTKCEGGNHAEVITMHVAEFHAARRFEDTPFGRIAFIERGSGDPALFVHGLPLNGFHWRSVIESLAGHRRCVEPDLMGLGYTEVPEARTPAL